MLLFRIWNTRQWAIIDGSTSISLLTALLETVLAAKSETHHATLVPGPAEFMCLSWAWRTRARQVFLILCVGLFAAVISAGLVQLFGNWVIEIVFGAAMAVGVMFAILPTTVVIDDAEISARWLLWKRLIGYDRISDVKIRMRGLWPARRTDVVVEVAGGKKLIISFGSSPDERKQARQLRQSVRRHLRRDHEDPHHHEDPHQG